MNINVTNEGIQAKEYVPTATVRWPDRRRWDTSEKDARFKSLFGVSSLIIAEIWYRIEETVSLEDTNAEKKHLLWALVFPKVYATEEINCAIVGWPSAETFRKYSWYFIKKCFDLEDKVIVWHSRFDGQPDLEDIEHDCMISVVDCLDCPCSKKGSCKP